MSMRILSVICWLGMGLVLGMASPVSAQNSETQNLETEIQESNADVFVERAAIDVDDQIILSTTLNGSGTATYSLRSSGANQIFFQPYFNANQNLLDYLTSPNVQKQIELSSDQKKQFAEIRKKMSESMSQVASRFPQLRDPKISKEKRNELNKNYSVELKKVRQEFEEEVKESLVPQQLNLIKQLRFQTSTKLLGFSRTISGKPFGEELKTTDKQKKAIEKIKAEAEAEIQKMIEELRQKAKEKMLKELNRSQRDKIKELEGKAEKKPTKL